MDQLENLLRGATNPGALAEVDVDRARQLLGDDAAESLERMAEVARMLEEAGLIEHKEGRYELTPRGIRRIGQNALADLYRKLQRDRVGDHHLDRVGAGHERAYETKPYEFGDPFNLSDREDGAQRRRPRRGRARRCGSHPRTSRSSAPSSRPAPQRC